MRGPAAADLDAYLETQERRDLLRFLTCGSVDDGKSTLIGRLLYESHLIFDDQLAAVAADSKRVGTQGGELDLALLVDGLSAEREQGITIDVAYRYFATEHRKFIVADTPGHEQYTRNMVTGASTADVAVILVDARKGVLTQTRRHSYLVSLLGIRTVAVAVNKLDLVGYSHEIFEQIESDYRSFAEQIGITNVTCIPLSALRGDNVTAPSERTPWYHGPTLLGWLETVEAGGAAAQGPFRFPVQLVVRPDADFRGFAGTVVGGSVRPGDPVVVLPGGQRSTVERIVTYDGDRREAVTGASVTLTLRDEVDVSRGDMLAAADGTGVADQFEATVVWMHEHDMLPGRPYLVKIGTRTVGGSLGVPKYRVNVNTLEHVAARTLALNDIGSCNLTLDRPVAFDAYADNRDTGGFIVIDRITSETVAAGMLHFALRRSQNVRWQHLVVDKEAHASLKGHRPCVVWFTGLSGAGKSTVANEVERRLHARGMHTFLLDGDNVRHGLNRDLGFTEADRVENVRRVAEVARLMTEAGLIVLVSFISPFRAERRMARGLVGPDEFCEVFVDAPLEVAEGRDPKGLYLKARAGQIRNFTGIDSPYEPPEHPDLHLDTTTLSPEQAAEAVLAKLQEMGVVH